MRGLAAGNWLRQWHDMSDSQASFHFIAKQSLWVGALRSRPELSRLIDRRLSERGKQIASQAVGKTPRGDCVQLRHPGQRAGAVHTPVWTAQLCTGGCGITEGR